MSAAGAVLASVTAGSAATDVGHSLREAFYMFWDTLWALVLGFGLSGAVQAFVSREAMRRSLGDHRPASLARATVFGMASSSCSYAASAMARSLVARGADFLAAMVFLFASTNLVVELGIVLAVLIGWQFVAAEFFGGVIMLLLLVSVGGLWLRGRVVVEGRAVAEQGQAAPGDAETAPAGPGRAAARMRTAAGWSDAAAYTMSDLRMLRVELAIGFLVAGVLATVVPTQLWNDVFLHGHGFWTSLENVVVGPLVAIVSFVCSIGNVPLAAALWHGGISFGGVVSFVFADLITLPLLMIYRKQYGGRLARRMLLVFWSVMSAAGLATEYLFRALGWIPRSRPATVAPDRVGLDATTLLDVLALVVFAALLWLARNQSRLGGGGGYARDPVCGMQVEIAHAPARLDGVYFCCDGCRDRYAAAPDRFAVVAAGDAVDPICGMTVAAGSAVATDGQRFCSSGCRDEWERRKTLAESGLRLL